jgi:hypothetical protein
MDEPIKTHGFISQLTIKVALKMATRNPESYEQYSIVNTAICLVQLIHLLKKSSRSVWNAIWKKYYRNFKFNDSRGASVNFRTFKSSPRIIPRPL